MKCWVDDDEWMGVTVIGYWKEIVNIGRYVFLLSIRLPSYLSPELCIFFENVIESGRLRRHRQSG